MTNVVDVDAAISRLAGLLSVTYDQARQMVQSGDVSFQIPVTDANIAVTTSIGASEFEPSKIQVSGKTAVRQRFTQVTTSANNHYTIYTPTATLYITDVVFTAFGAADYRFGDNTSGNARPTDGTTGDDVHIGTGAQDVLHLHFSSPLVISTALKCASSSTTGFSLNFVGWEE